MEIYNDIQLINCSNNIQLENIIDSKLFLYTNNESLINLVNNDVYQICPINIEKEELVSSNRVSIDDIVDFLSIKDSNIESKINDINNIFNASQLIITANILIQYYGVSPSDVYSLLAVGNKLLFINNKFLIMKK